MSFCLMQLCRRLPSSCSNWSPVLWPSASLTCFEVIHIGEDQRETRGLVTAIAGHGMVKVIHQQARFGNWVRGRAAH